MKSVSKVNRDIERSTDTNEWPQAGDEATLVSTGMTTFNKTVKITYIGDSTGYYLDLSSGKECMYLKHETVFSKPKIRCGSPDLISKTISRGSDIERSADANEWPKVGDTAEYNNSQCEVLLTADSSGHIVAKDKNSNYINPHIDDIKKPKTPEEKLRCELWDLISETISRDSDIDSIVTDIMNDYTLTKKPD